jgi:uncharacterized protein (TIGR00725 family)
MLKTIGVIGESEATEENYSYAYEVGKLIGKSGAALVCGGLSGVMEAACKGAKETGGLTIGILPMLEKGGANPYVDIPIPTGIGYARNVIVVRSSDAIIAVGGKYGTLSELGFALDGGVPVIGLNTWRLKDYKGATPPIQVVKTPEEAVRAALAKV